MPRILVADDHPKVRRHVCDALESQKGWEVCGEAATGRDAVTMTAAYRPDIVVLDLSMPELNGLEAAREILEKFPQTVVLILTMHDVQELIREVLASGARACLTKSNLQHLIDEVRNVIRDIRNTSKVRSNSIQEMLVHTVEPEIGHPGSCNADRFDGSSQS